MSTNNVAFYIMNSKGLHVLKNFISQYGGRKVEYIVCGRDQNVINDYFDEIKEVANENDIKFYNRKDLDYEMENSYNGFIFAIGWRWLINKESKTIVFHDSILPYYRGFSPLVNSLINNENYIGVTALFANEFYDCGDIICQEKIELNHPIKIKDAIALIEPLYYQLVKNIYKKIELGEKIVASKQDETKATYSIWLDEHDYFIDWSWSAEKIKRFVDAVGYPYDGAKAKLNNESVTISNVKILSDVAVENRLRHIGKVIYMTNGNPVVICGSGLLRLNEVLDINKKAIKIKFRSRFE